MRQAILALVTLALVGCIDTPKENPLPRAPSLFKRMGGAPKIETITDAFLDQVVLTDELPRSRRERFLGAERAESRKQVIAQLTAATGGPIENRAEVLAQGPFQMNIKDPDSVAILGALQRALKSCRLFPRDEEDLLKALEPVAPVPAPLPAPPLIPSM